MYCSTVCLHELSGFAQSGLIANHIPLKVGILGYGNLRTMDTDKWATSKSTQLSTKVWVKVLLLLENALKIHFDDVVNMCVCGLGEASNFQLVRGPQ